MNSFLTITLYTIYQVLEVGIMDALEYKFVNSKVFYHHNFPDILGFRNGSKPTHPLFAAFLSGVICTIPLFIPFILKLFLAFVYRKKIDKPKLARLYILLYVFFTIADLAILVTYNQKHASSPGNFSYIYRNHRLFYGVHIFSEIASFLMIFISIIWRK